MATDPPSDSLVYVCCLCETNPQQPVDWHPGIGAICWECALQHWTKTA